METSCSPLLLPSAAAANRAILSCSFLCNRLSLDIFAGISRRLSWVSSEVNMSWLSLRISSWVVVVDITQIWLKKGIDSTHTHWIFLSILLWMCLRRTRHVVPGWLSVCLQLTDCSQPAWGCTMSITSLVPSPSPSLHSLPSQYYKTQQNRKQ